MKFKFDEYHALFLIMIFSAPDLMFSRLLALHTSTLKQISLHLIKTLIQFCWVSHVAFVVINNFSGALFYWRFDQHNMRTRTWTIDLWSELYLEVVSIEATKIATYFSGLKGGSSESFKPPLPTSLFVNFQINFMLIISICKNLAIAS